jgi:hypothetical protein
VLRGEGRGLSGGTVRSGLPFACEPESVVGVPRERRWVPPKPGSPPGGDPRLVGGYWTPVDYKTAEELEQGRASARAEQRGISELTPWLAHEASAPELLAALWTGIRARMFAADTVREAWRRLASSGELPATDRELVRLEHRLVRRSLRDRSAWIVQTELGDALGPLWHAPKGLERESTEIGEDARTDAFLDSSGALYQTVAAGRLRPVVGKRVEPSLVAGRVGVPIAFPAKARCEVWNGLGSIGGDQIRSADGPAVLRSSVSWTKEVRAPLYVTAVCVALLP